MTAGVSANGGATTGDGVNTIGCASAAGGVTGGPTGDVTGILPLVAMNRCMIPLVPFCGVNRRV